MNHDGVVDGLDYGTYQSNYGKTGCGGGNITPKCTPSTCSNLGKSCGSFNDSCSGTLNCGTCPNGQNCSNGVCICVPNCQGHTCGMDPVCGTLNCGSCNYGYVCLNMTCQISSFNNSNITNPSKPAALIANNVSNKSNNTDTTWCNGADMNHDGVVDGLDYGILQNNYEHTNCSDVNSWCNWADANKDRIVDGLDYGIWQNNYGHTSCNGNSIVPVNSSCIDSDGGLNYYVKGIATGIFDGINSNFSDSCCIKNAANDYNCNVNSGASVSEVYCEGAYIRTTIFDCQNGCSNGACLSSNYNLTNTNNSVANGESNSTNLTMINNSVASNGGVSGSQIPISQISNITGCSGCMLDNQCHQVGYITGGLYCTISNQFLEQKNISESCENNYECSSNSCSSGKCVSPGLIQTVVRWFANLFGTSSTNSTPLTQNINSTQGNTDWCNGADINHDGTVDASDNWAWQNNYGQVNCSNVNSWCNGADANKDSVVDGLDYGIWQNNYGKTNCSALR